MAGRSQTRATIDNIKDLFLKRNVSDEAGSKAELKLIFNEPALEEIEVRKKDLHSVLYDLLRYNREICAINVNIKSNKEKHDFERMNLNAKKVEIMSSIAEHTVKENNIRDIDRQLRKSHETELCYTNEMEIQRQKVECNAKCTISELKKLKNLYLIEQNSLIEKLEFLKTKFTDIDISKIEEKIRFLENSFQHEMLNIAEFQRKLVNLTLESDTSSEVCECTTTTSSTSFELASSFDRVEDFLAKQPTLETEKEYVKEFLGPALKQGLAAITLYQPTDPIYFLSNYLVHCRHNEHMHLKKSIAFQNLMHTRKEINEPKLIETKCLACAECKYPCKHENTDEPSPCKSR